LGSLTGSETRTGMTLVELVIIITLVGIMAFAMAPRFNTYRRIELRSAIKELAADVRFAQSRAIATRVRYGLVFDPGSERYTVYRGETSTPATDFLNPGKPMRKHRDGVDIVAAEFDGAASFEFDSMGVPYNETGNELIADGYVVFSAGTETDTVRVNALTGRVEY
jgi:type II secretory pathway pseudopilin PulG